MMISDKSLMKISFLVAVVGIVCLFITNLVIQPENLSIGNITSSKVGREVIVSGIISSMSTKDGHVFITLDDNNSNIKVVMFATTARNYPAVYNLTRNDKVTAKGKVENYKGELEIIADVIERCLL